VQGDAREQETRDYKNNHWDERERAWQQEKDRDAARAIARNRSLSDIQ
jgi:hypothetical protein